MGKKKYVDYIIEIEELKRKHKLSAKQVLVLQIAASLKVDNLNYEMLKEEFCSSRIEL